MNSTLSLSARRAAGWLSLLLVLSTARASTLTTQTFNLQAGWNSVWLEVQPTNDTPAFVFGGLPLEQAWTFRQRLPAVDFIEDPSEPVWNRDRWMSWAPAGRPEAVANSLFAVPAQRAYLIKLTSAATLTVTGEPRLERAEWRPDAYTLRGFPIDPGVPPTFREFFRTSAAHFDAPANEPREVYALSATGTWVEVEATDLMQAGVAYWVYSQGGSDFIAPFEAKISGGGQSLEFGRQVIQFTLQLLNSRATAVAATVGEVGAPAAGVLTYAQFDPELGTTWADLPTLLPRPLAANGEGTLRLAARRQVIPAALHESLVEIRDNQGTRFLVPVRIERTPVATEVARRHAGLWMGVASVSAVSEAHSGPLTTNGVARDGTPITLERTGVSVTPTPTRSAFPLRLLLHVDNDGAVRLLREVTQMWQDGTYQVNAEGLREVATPGRFVLLTDSSKFGQFKGVESRGEAVTGRRFSSVGFDFPGSGANNANNFITLAGTFAAGQTVSGTIQLAESFATNPFRHKYHPDHDNLDARFTDFRAEAYAVTRAIEIEFSATDPGGGSSNPDYGYNHIAGTYRETVTGLHRQPINASGLFRLRRVSDVAVLNP